MVRLLAILALVIALANGQTVRESFARDSVQGSPSFLTIAGKLSDSPCRGKTTGSTAFHLCWHSGSHTSAVQGRAVPMQSNERSAQVGFQTSDVSLSSIIPGRDPPIPRPLT